MIGGKIVVYTSGTFDMLHINHLRLIEYARGLGEILIVGVNTDELVASYKSTPMIPFEDRIALMRAIKGPDLVIPQHSLDHRDKVKKLKFDGFVITFILKYIGCQWFILHTEEECLLLR